VPCEVDQTCLGANAQLTGKDRQTEIFLIHLGTFLQKEAGKTESRAVSLLLFPGEDFLGSLFMSHPHCNTYCGED